MKVSVIVGGRFHAFDLAAHLHRKGALHRLITNFPRFGTRRWHVPDDRVVSLPSTLIAGRMMSKISPKLVQKCQYRLSRWFADSAARQLDGSDLIVAWSSFAEPAVQWANQHGVPSLVERGSAHIVEQDELLRQEHQLLGLPWPGIDPNVIAMELREYDACTQVSVPSLFVERSFLRRRHVPARLFRNPYGVDLGCFHPPVAPPQDPSPGSLRVVFSGNASAQKGTHYLLRAFAEARQPRWQLTLVGAMAAEARQWLIPIPVGVEFVGHRPQHELASIYGRMHCFVMPSIQDGFGMVLVQALACGLPLIATTNTGGEDLLSHNGVAGEHRDFDTTEFPAGYVVPIRRPDSIAWCLRQLACNPEVWRSKRQAALELARESLSWEQYGDRALARYQALVNGTPQQACAC
jgi:starch synthase